MEDDHQEVIREDGLRVTVWDPIAITVTRDSPEAPCWQALHDLSVVFLSYNPVR